MEPVVGATLCRVSTSFTRRSSTRWGQIKQTFRGQLRLTGYQARVVAALDLSRGGGNASTQDLLQRGKTRAIRGRIVLILVMLPVGVVIGVMWGGRVRSPHGSSVAHWRTVAGPALLIIGLLLEIIVIVTRIRSGQFKAGWRSPHLVLSRPQRRQILRQIRGRAPVDPSTLPVARHVAELLRRQRSYIALLLALSLILLGSALPHDDPFPWWTMIIVTAAYAAL